MTIHPRPLPSKAGHAPVEVPGLAYYVASPALPLPSGAEPARVAKPSAAAEALARMFGYYGPQD